VITYRKDEIEDLARAVGRHWGGQACDWRLVVEPAQHYASPALELHVEIALGGSMRITTIPLGKRPGDSAHRTAALATPPRELSHGGAAAVAAVRRATVQALLAQSTGDDIEPLLGYLRCCGILVIV
jgi:hypothetical protein